MNTVFSYFRERLLTGKEIIPGIEQNSLEDFFSNENSILSQENHPIKFAGFL
jgi:hypothetical protein